MHGATRRLRRTAAQFDLDLRGLDPRQQRRLLRRLTAWLPPAVVVRCPFCDEVLYRTKRRAWTPRTVTEIWPPASIHTCPRRQP